MKSENRKLEEQLKLWQQFHIQLFRWFGAWAGLLDSVLAILTFGFYMQTLRLRVTRRQALLYYKYSQGE